MSRTVADAFNQYHTGYVKPQVDSKAPKNSPALTGTPTAPTPENDTDSTQIATAEFCQNLIRRLVGAAPETLDTLVELATAINNDPKFAETIVQALDAKLNKSDAATIYATKEDLENVSAAGISETSNAVLFSRELKSGVTDMGEADLTYAISSGGSYKPRIKLREDGVVQITGGVLSVSMYRGGEFILASNGTSLTWRKDATTTNPSKIVLTESCNITAPNGLYVNGTKVA